MESTNNLNGLQQSIIPTPFQKAAMTQTAAMSNLDYGLWRKLVEEMIAADPTTNIGEASKMTRIVYADLTSLEIALVKDDVSIIKRIISVITATDPKNAQKRLLTLIEKISAHAAKQETPNITFLKKVLELPAFFGQEINSSSMSKFLGWAVDHDLGELVDFLVKSEILTDLDIQKVIRRSCKKGKINIFKALLQNEMIPKTELCNFKALERVSSRNYIEMVKLIQPHYIPSADHRENNQVIMNKVVVGGYVEVAKFLEEKSIGNLNNAIHSHVIVSAVNGTVDMLQFALTRTNEKGDSLVNNTHLHNIITSSLNRNRPVGAIFAYKILLKRNALLNYRAIIISASISAGHNVGRNICLGFAYTLMQDYAEKFGKTKEWGNLAAMLLSAEIREENFHSIYHLLDDQFIDLSKASITVSSILEKIDNNDRNKEKWLEVLTKMLFHFNFDPYHYTKNIVNSLKSVTTDPDTIEILDFYLKSSKLIDFESIIRGISPSNE